MDDQAQQEAAIIAQNANRLREVQAARAARMQSGRNNRRAPDLEAGNAGEEDFDAEQIGEVVNFRRQPAAAPRPEAAPAA